MTGNTAERFGGGIYNVSIGSALSLSSTVVSGNTARVNGGIINVGGTVALDTISRVCGNTPQQCNGFSAPPGVCVNDCPV